MALAGAAVMASAPDIFRAPASRFKAIAFDAFPIFDPRPVAALAESLYAEKGKELANVWRTKQFEYCWLRTAADRYENFWKVTEDALLYAAAKTGVVLSEENRKRLMEQYMTLKVWDDVIPALQSLQQSGIKLVFLSNMTREMLQSCMAHNKIESYFDHVISTDDARTYKPDPDAYQLGIEILKLKKEEILFVAFAGWDASGSKWFGYPTFWVNRLSNPTEELNAVPDGIGKSMTDLVSFTGE
jgi:2-haloacid dehalogenase